MKEFKFIPEEKKEKSKEELIEERRAAFRKESLSKEFKQKPAEEQRRLMQEEIARMDAEDEELEAEEKREKEKPEIILYPDAERRVFLDELLEDISKKVPGSDIRTLRITNPNSSFSSAWRLIISEPGHLDAKLPPEYRVINESRYKAINWEIIDNTLSFVVIKESIAKEFPRTDLKDLEVIVVKGEIGSVDEYAIRFQLRKWK